MIWRATADAGPASAECDALCLEIGELLAQKDLLLPANPRRRHLDDLLAEKRRKVDALLLGMERGGDDFAMADAGRDDHAGDHHQDLAA